MTCSVAAESHGDAHDLFASLPPGVPDYRSAEAEARATNNGAVEVNHSAIPHGGTLGGQADNEAFTKLQAHVSFGRAMVDVRA